MHDLILADLLESPKFFKPNTGHRVIEVYGHGDSKDLQINDFHTTDKTLGTIWSGVNHASSGKPLLLRLLVCTPRVLDQDIWPLPLSANSLRSLLAALEIPSLFPRAICHHIPIATDFDSFLDNGRFGVILRTNLTHAWQYALAVVYDPEKNTTNGVILGLKGEEVTELLLSVKQTSPKDLACPLALPCILIDKTLDAVVKDAENRRRSLTQICQQLSADGFYHPEIYDEQLQRECDVVDLDRVMKLLTGMSDVCAGISAVCMMQKHFIEVLASFLKRWDRERANVASRRMEQRLEMFKQFLHGIESKIIYTRTSVQGQIQTIYTLITQRESRSQVELGKITRRLAELSQRDSTHMRIIAAATLVFLPATFVATFFSTSFFNFQPGGSNHISPWIWLYCLLTTILTALTLFLWWHAMRSEKKKTKAALRRQSKLIEQTLQRRNTAAPTELTLVTPRAQVLRPYLSGSEAEVFQKKGKNFIVEDTKCHYLLTRDESSPNSK